MELSLLAEVPEIKDVCRHKVIRLSYNKSIVFYSRNFRKER